MAGSYGLLAGLPVLVSCRTSQAENGSVNPRDGRGGKDFWHPNDVEVKVVSPGVFFLFCCFFLHILVCFILVWCIRCLVVSRLVMLEPYLEETNKKGQVTWMVSVGPCDFWLARFPPQLAAH